MSEDLQMRTTAALLGLMLLLAGCTGGDGSEPSAPGGSPSAVSPSAEAPASASAAAAAAKLLPASALKDVPPYGYAKVPGAEDLVPPQITALGDYVEGYLGRAIRRDGKTLGTISLIRFQKGAISDTGSTSNGDQVLRELVKGFSHEDDVTTRRVGDLDMLLAPDAGTTKGSVIGWHDGRDMLLVFTAPSLSPVEFARSYRKA